MIDRLILDSYDHLLDITGTAKRKTAKELAYLKEQKDISELLDEVEDYEVRWITDKYCSIRRLSFMLEYSETRLIESLRAGPI